MPAAPGTMVNSVLNRAVQYFQDPENRQRIQRDCIDPLLKHILDRMFPYIILTCILFSLILLFSLTSVGLLIFQLHTVTKKLDIIPSIASNLSPITVSSAMENIGNALAES
jgi:hypothetical protein